MNWVQVTEEYYGLKISRINLLLAGVNETWLVDSEQGKYILRNYRSAHRSTAQIQEEVDLLLILKQEKVSVSFPIPDLSGNHLLQLAALPENPHVVLFSYAAGEPVKSLNPAQLENLGGEMAAFHNVSSQIKTGNARWRFDFDTTLFRPLEWLKPYFKESPEDHRWLRASAIRAEKVLSQMDPAQFSKGYCHFDFLPKNFHFENDRVTFFDFDFMGRGWLANDIMSFWQHLILDIYTKRTTLDDAKNDYGTFLIAYHTVRPFSEEELQAVPYLSLGFWLFYMGFHTTHEQFYQFLKPEHLRKVVGFLRKLVEDYWKME